MKIWQSDENLKSESESQMMMHFLRRWNLTLGVLSSCCNATNNQPCWCKRTSSVENGGFWFHLLVISPSISCCHAVASIGLIQSPPRRESARQIFPNIFVTTNSCHSHHRLIATRHLHQNIPCTFAITIQFP